MQATYARRAWLQLHVSHPSADTAALLEQLRDTHEYDAQLAALQKHATSYTRAICNNLRST